MALSDDDKRRLGLFFSDPAALRTEIDTEEAAPPVDAIQQMSDAAANDEIRRALTPKGTHESPMDQPVALPGQTITLPDQQVSAPLPRAPIAAPKRIAAGAPKPAAEKPVDLDAFLQQYGEPEEPPDPSEQPAPGLMVASEQRKESNFKLDPLDRSELDEQRDTEYRAENDLLHAEEDARAAGRAGEQWKQEWKGKAQEEVIARDRERLDKYKALQSAHAKLGKEIAAEDITAPSRWTGNFGDDMLSWVGTFLLGVGGGPELMQKKIQQDLDRNLQVQKERIAKKRADWETDGLLLGQVAKVYETEAAQDAAARDITLQGIEDMFARYQATAQDPAVKARAEMGLAQIRQQRVIEQAALEQATKDEVVRAYAAPKPTGGGGDPLKQLKLEKEYRELQGWKPELYVPAANGYATDPEQKKVMIKAGVAKSNLQTTLLKLRKLADEVASAKVPKTEASTRANVLIREAQLAIKDAKELGALDKGSLEVAQDMVPSISVSNPNASSAYEELIQRTEIGYRNQMRESGIVDGDPPPNFRRAGREGLDIQAEEPGGG